LALLSDRDRQDVQQQLANLTGPVTLINFTQELGCRYCRDTERLLKEVAELSDKIHLDIYNLQIDKQQAARYQVDKVPATAVVGAKDYGIRFYGIPMGYAFSALLGAIQDVSRGGTDLTAETRALVGGLLQPLRLQVFSTPT
jgi:alkyl hydroperoxide reductase subunit AhpF